jgi:hypothetical protein
MRVICPNCSSNIFNQDINVSANVAYCQECTNIFKLSELLDVKDGNSDKNQDIQEIKSSNIELSSNSSINLTKKAKNHKNSNFIDIDSPPNGVKMKKFDNGFEISATTRSPIAFFLVPFMLVWSGGSLGGIYGTQIANGHFNLFLSLFGIPFVMGTILFGSIAIMAVVGKISIRIKDNEGIIFTGIGSTGMQKFFKVDEINSIREEHKSASTGSIILEGKQRITFGSGLTDERRYYIVQSLKKLLDK